MQCSLSVRICVCLAGSTNLTTYVDEGLFLCFERWTWRIGTIPQYAELGVTRRYLDTFAIQPTRMHFATRIEHSHDSDHMAQHVKAEVGVQ
jgi:hypothetical protein